MSFSVLAPIAFALHYVTLRVSVACGLYYTASPLDIRWRWRQWKHIREMRRRFGI